MEEQKKGEEEEVVEEVIEDKKDEAEEQAPEAKEDFTKDKTVAAGKYNQAIRQKRALEAEIRELKKGSKEPKEDEEQDEEEEEFFADDTEKIVNEKLKPVLDSIKKKEAKERQTSRSEFIKEHPEYEDKDKWNSLLDELDNSINPNSEDDHYTQLTKAHRILSPETYNPIIENKAKEIAGTTSFGGSSKTTNSLKLTKDEILMKNEMGVSDEAIIQLRKYEGR